MSGLWAGLGSLVCQGLSGPGFLGGFVCGLRKIVGFHNFSVQFVGAISHFKGIGYTINILQQNAC